MRKLLMLLTLTAGLESGALACSCIAPGPAEESRTFAREAAPGIVAIVEAEAISGYRFDGTGERVRVRRTLFGKAPRTLRLQRGPSASSASCDLLLEPGQRKVLMLRRGKGGAYRMQGLCDDFLTSERYLPMLIDEARRSSGKPRKAGERASLCPPRRLNAGA